MDVILDFCDHYALDQAYAYLLPYPHTPSALTQLNNTGMPLSYDSTITNHPAFKPTSYLPRDSMIRQSISLYIIAAVGAAAMYFLFCSISYFCFFDRRLEHHPRFLKNQIRMEIKSSMIAIPWIDAMTLPWFLGEIRGHSMIYDNVSDYGWTYFVFSVALYLLFTDFFIYWIHRLEHHPSIYKHVHKPHHKWISEFILDDRRLTWGLTDSTFQCQHPGPLSLFTRWMDTPNPCPTISSSTSSPCTNTSISVFSSLFSCGLSSFTMAT
jgi:lathosterol oxidase